MHNNIVEISNHEMYMCYCHVY